MIGDRELRKVGVERFRAGLQSSVERNPDPAHLVAGELRGGKIVGQLPADAEDVEQFGIVLDKDSPLTRCVSSAVDGLRSDGTLTRLEQQWLSGAGSVPVLR